MIATHLINRFPSKVLHFKLPYEILHGKSPDYNRLRSFGCSAYASTSPIYKGKFDSIVEACAFIGYPYTQRLHAS